MTKEEKRERVELAAEFFFESLSQTQRNIVENFFLEGHGIGTRMAATGDTADAYYELVELRVLDVSAQQLTLSGLGRYLGDLVVRGRLRGAR